MNRWLAVAALGVVLSAGPVQAGWNPFDGEKKESHQAKADGPRQSEVAQAIEEFKAKDPSMQAFFDKAAGYAVFPDVKKGGFLLAGAYGEGWVYRGGTRIGSAKLEQVTVGLQAGAQAYREIIFFGTREALERFTSNRFEFSAQASAVAADEGAAANADYNDGVAVFTVAKGGLMLEASVGGQKFTYWPVGAKRPVDEQGRSVD